MNIDAWTYLHENTALLDALGIRSPKRLEIGCLGQGEHNENFWFQDADTGRRYVLRVNVAPQPFHENQVAYEFAALQALEPSGCTPKPLFIDDSDDAPGHGVLVESFCPGRELDFDNLQVGDLDCAVRLMADVHAVPVDERCPLYRPHDPMRTLFEECVGRYEAYSQSGIANDRILDWGRRFLDAAARELEASVEPQGAGHIVNTEPLPSHFLICKQSLTDDSSQGACPDTPGYFLDWERPIVGEPAQDLAYFTSPTTTFWDSEWLFPESEIEGLLARYWEAVDGRFADAGFEKRFFAWRVMTILRSVTWCCKALITYGPLLDANADEEAPRSFGCEHPDAAPSDPEHPDAAPSGGFTTPATKPSPAHTTAKTAAKLPIYLSDEFMEMCWDVVQA